MIYCPNCGKLCGFKRSLGFGTFFMVLLTCGIWLLVIPLYPARCINCGLRRAPAIMQNFIDWLRGVPPPLRAVISVGILLGIIALGAMASWDNQVKQGPADIVDGPAYSAAKSASEDHELHLLPNAFGQGAVSDGRTYSIGLLTAYQDRIPPTTELFTQGVIGGISYRGAFGVASPWDIFFLRDEQDRDKVLACLVAPEEIEGTNFPYRVGDRVQLHGKYYVAYGYEGVLNFRDCKFSSATNNVVKLRTLQAQSGQGPVAVQQFPSSTQTTDTKVQTQQTEPIGGSPEDGSIGNPENSTLSSQLEQLEQRRESLSIRAISVSDILHKLRDSQTVQGRSLPSDILASQQRMQAQLYAAKSTLKGQDVKRTRECLDWAETEVVNLEKFLGR